MVEPRRALDDHPRQSLNCVIADGRQSLAIDLDGTLTMGIDLDGANYNPFVQKFLGDHL